MQFEINYIYLSYWIKQNKIAIAFHYYQQIWCTQSCLISCSCTCIILFYIYMVSELWHAPVIKLYLFTFLRASWRFKISIYDQLILSKFLIATIVSFRKATKMKSFFGIFIVFCVVVSGKAILPEPPSR